MTDIGQRSQKQGVSIFNKFFAEFDELVISTRGKARHWAVSGVLGKGAGIAYMEAIEYIEKGNYKV